jgi:hypothetical protein
LVVEQQKGASLKALEFETKLGTDANLSVPADLAVQIPKEEPVRVIILVPECAEGESWPLLTREQFLRGYSDSDSVYDGV